MRIEMLIDEIDNRINYTERQIIQEEKELRKTQDRIENLKGELQGYKNIITLYTQLTKGNQNDIIENH